MVGSGDEPPLQPTDGLIGCMVRGTLLRLGRDGAGWNAWGGRSGTSAMTVAPGVPVVMISVIGVCIGVTDVIEPREKSRAGDFASVGCRCGERESY